MKEIRTGNECVKTTVFKYMTCEGELVQKNRDIIARKIPFQQMRQRLLEKHENLDIIRQHNDDYYDMLSLA